MTKNVPFTQSQLLSSIRIWNLSQFIDHYDKYYVNLAQNFMIPMKHGTLCSYVTVHACEAMGFDAITKVVL